MGDAVLQTDWLAKDEIKTLVKRGDLLEFRRDATIYGQKRRVYTHWGLYYGVVDEKHYVLHMSNEDGDFEGAEMAEGHFASFADSLQTSGKISGGSKAHVRSDLFDRVAGNDLVRINNSMDHRHTPFPPTIIIERASQRLGDGGYSIMMNNCEHFVKWCRYGHKNSDQAVMAKSALLSSVLLGVNPFMAAGVGIAYYFVANPLSRTINRAFGTNFSLF